MEIPEGMVPIDMAAIIKEWEAGLIGRAIMTASAAYAEVGETPNPALFELQVGIYVAAAKEELIVLLQMLLPPKPK